MFPELVARPSAVQYEDGRLYVLKRRMAPNLCTDRFFADLSKSIRFLIRDTAIYQETAVPAIRAMHC